MGIDSTLYRNSTAIYRTTNKQLLFSHLQLEPAPVPVQAVSAAANSRG